jgi:nucleoside-diphosphate-sugar epimerase
MSVMVTGIGHVGGYVVRDLLAAGERVVLYGYFGGNGDPKNLDLPDLNYLDGVLGGALRDKADIVIGDVSDLDAITQAAERYGVRSIVHLASLVSAGAEANPPRAVRVNVEGTANVFETASRLRLEKVVWASSIDVFGARSVPDSGVITDGSSYDPVNAYGAGKVMCEQLALRYYDNHGTDITGLRLSRVYGFGEHIKAARGGGSSWLSSLLYDPAVGAGPSVVPFGRRHLDFHYVEDVAGALVGALHHRDGRGISYITHGDYRPIAEAVEFVRELLPDAQVTLDPDDKVLPAGSSISWSRRYDASGAEAALGIRSRFSMETGLYRTLNANRVFAGLPDIPRPPGLLDEDFSATGPTETLGDASTPPTPRCVSTVGGR